MAKGKQAVRAANRRVDAVNGHVDRLTDQLGEAKAKARQFEKDARRLPHVLAENEGLREQIAANTYQLVEKLQAENDRLRSELDTAVEDVAHVRQLWEKVLDRIIDHFDGDPVGIERLNRLMEFFDGEDARGVHGSEYNGRAQRSLSTVHVMRARRQISQQTARRLEQRYGADRQVPPPLDENGDPQDTGTLTALGLGLSRPNSSDIEAAVASLCETDDEP